MPGSSAYFLGGVVAYANEAKQLPARCAGSPCSRSTARSRTSPWRRAMAEGARASASAADYRGLDHRHLRVRTAAPTRSRWGSSHMALGYERWRDTRRPASSSRWTAQRHRASSLRRWGWIGCVAQAAGATSSQGRALLRRARRRLRRQPAAPETQPGGSISSKTREISRAINENSQEVRQKTKERTEKRNRGQRNEMAAKKRGSEAPKAPVDRETDVGAKRKAIELAVSNDREAVRKRARSSDDGRRRDAIAEIGCFSSGSAPVLDIALGIGGYPRGSGHRDLRAGVEWQDDSRTARRRGGPEDAGGVAAFIDAEHALDVNYARRLGVNVEDLLVSQPDTGEQALEITDDARALQRHRCRRHRLRGRPGAARRDRRRDGGLPRGPAGPADEPGAAQAHGDRRQVETPRWSSSTRSG